ncbi:MAG TPA: flagellar M-ring protein FliF, partial [Alphaproteobacteria bacterium]|nr:flagellar M-ring protein FliF [Alphaproteobacteria bacterium]
VVQQMGPQKIVTMIIVTLIMVISFVFISARISQPNMQLLYGGLEAKEASLIADKLATMAIKYEVRGESNIYVPNNKVGELRLKIAGEGLVGNSIKGYEVFDNSSSFGTTSLVQNINSRRALEGEIARTIMSLPAVKNARVHLVIPKKRLFLKENTKTTASVVVNVGSRVLQEEQINSIMHVVASSVPNLLPEDVSIVDNRGKLLSAGEGQNDMSKITTSEKYKSKIENKYQAQITNMLETIIGVGKVNVKVSAEVDMNSMEETSEIYDPKNQVVRSEQTNEEELSSQGASTSSAVGTASNLDDGNNTDSDGSMNNGPKENQTKSQSTINYEISKTVRHSIKQAGKITKLSVAVVLEGKYKTTGEGENATRQYIPLTESQLAKIKALIKSAMGFNTDRGDVVEVVDLPFTEIEELPEPEKDLLAGVDVMKIVEYILLLIGFVVMVIFVIKPILTTTHHVVRAKMPKEVKIPEPIISQAALETNEEDEEENDMLVNVTNVEGKVRDASIKKAANIIENHPEESTQVIRKWMLSDVPTK